MLNNLTNLAINQFKIFIYPKFIFSIAQKYANKQIKGENKYINKMCRYKGMKYQHRTLF